MADRSAGHEDPPIRFCETNPFRFVVICDGSIVCAGTYVICRAVCKWVRSGKRTHLEGGNEAIFMGEWVRLRGSPTVCGTPEWALLDIRRAAHQAAVAARS